jgi:hypothetical protein
LQRRLRAGPPAWRKSSGCLAIASLRDLPDIERLKAEGLMQRGQGEEDDLDSVLGLAGEDQDPFESAGEELDTATDF